MGDFVSRKGETFFLQPLWSRPTSHGVECSLTQAFFRVHTMSNDEDSDQQNLSSGDEEKAMDVDMDELQEDAISFLSMLFWPPTDTYWRIYGCKREIRGSGMAATRTSWQGPFFLADFLKYP